jgi:RNA-directed DNA polymerase
MERIGHYVQHESVPTSDWSLIAREIGELIQRRKLQMTALAGAPSTRSTVWKTINWDTVVEQVNKLQLRIAKAIKMGRYAKAKALQWLLTHSFFAKLLAIKRVTQNSGKRTPGIDGVIWKTDNQKMAAAYELKRAGYKAQPLRRIYIPKKNGKLRPLGIPTKTDRAQQALHLMGLMPIAEILADENSYGFRPKRSTHDAIAQCFNLLSREVSPQWVLEGDIKACFDKISHNWLVEKVMMDKHVLEQWLKAGYMEKEVFHDTVDGCPQGGVSSPTLANIALDGLESTVLGLDASGEKINFVRYADDFICTANSKETLENKVKPAIIKFLKERGLELSIEKTKITHINDGFDFLGFNIRKYGEKLLIKPSNSSVKKFSDSLRETIQKLGNSPTVKLIASLNSKIRGWTNYYRSCVAKEIFNDIDKVIFDSIWNMLKRKHSNKNISWIRNKYFTRIGSRNWCFFCKIKTQKGEKRYTLIKASQTTIRRHIKIKGKATPFDNDFHSYFTIREDRLKRERINSRIVNNNNLKGA